ncbi:ATP-binding cassette domain-containing protein [Streptococcus porcinus]|uniref:ATP-binding cassette domain-containing protein n=2 Tax=Streptococcus porcinus TaxID=1340 RepID=A0A7V9WR31_STRPO|nr:ATP-binding cassette domain-containing protein [Streptococcus porcinus]
MSNGGVLNFSLILKKPFRILIIGKSGSGKTTLFNLISGAVPLTTGKIFYIGKDGEEVRNKFVPIVYQTPHIFDTTVRNNITLFQNRLYDDDMLKMILRKINLYDELESNSLLEFECGENGYKLSGGQKQKIALARALVRSRDIYLFDEISANLDKENSRQIHNLLFDLDISFIEIAHHYDVSDNRYTNIYSLENGQLNQVK